MMRFSQHFGKHRTVRAELLAWAMPAHWIKTVV